MFDDLHALPESEQEAAGHRLVQQELLHFFDLAQGPLFRVRLVRRAEREHLLLITMHQVIGDGWSLGVLVDELFTVYDAFSAQAGSPLAPLSIQYADFAQWQRRWQSHPDLVAQLAYWRERLRDPLPQPGLAMAGRRWIIDDLRTARRGLALPASLSEAAKRFGQREGGSLFMALLTGLKILLYRQLGQEDLRVATLVANRNRPGTERIIGPLANMVILRTNLGGDPSTREVMRRVRGTALAAFVNQDLPFEEIVESLRERALKPVALASIMITLRNAALRPMRTSDHSLAFEEANPTLQMPLVPATTFDIIVALNETANGIAGICVYKPHLFDTTTIDQLLRGFRSVLEQMVMWPERSISSIRVPPK